MDIKMNKSEECRWVRKFRSTEVKKNKHFHPNPTTLIHGLFYLGKPQKSVKCHPNFNQNLHLIYQYINAKQIF